MTQEEDRRITLLKATYTLLKKYDKGPYAQDALLETVFYDGADCDGYCLMIDIEDCLREYNINIGEVDQ